MPDRARRVVLTVPAAEHQVRPPTHPASSPPSPCRGGPAPCGRWLAAVPQREQGGWGTSVLPTRYTHPYYPPWYTHPYRTQPSHTELMHHTRLPGDHWDMHIWSFLDRRRRT